MICVTAKTECQLNYYAENQLNCNIECQLNYNN